MAAVELNFDPSAKQLRQFGIIGLVAFPLIGWLFSGKPPITDFAAWEPKQTKIFAGFCVAAIAFGALAFTKPSLLKWVFITASVITFPIGFVLGEIVMLLIFALAFVPMSLVFRWIGRDSLDRTLDRETESYWVEKQQAKDASSYFRQS